MDGQPDSGRPGRTEIKILSNFILFRGIIVIYAARTCNGCYGLRYGLPHRDQ